MKRPNLLFLFTDQQRYDTLKVYGNKKIQTPNLNKLVEKSAVFKNAYVTQPVCTPSRGSILTGLYPHNHGSIQNNIPLSDDVPSIAELMQGSGYKTAYMGKWHLGNEMIRQHGFDEWVSTEEYRSFLTKAEYRSLNCSYHDFLIRNGFKPDEEGEDYNAFTRYFCTRIPEELSKPAFTASEACRFISENRDGNFMLYVNFLEPHPPYYSAFDDMYDPDEVDLPRLFDMEPGEDTPLKYRFNRQYYKEVGRHYPMKDEKAWRKLIARYWGSISLVDKYAGRILDALQENGLDGNTVVVFTSDHGDMMGDFRMLMKNVMYESSVKVPLFIKVPGHTDNQRIVEEPVSHIDIVPTLLDILDCSTDKKLDGKSLYPVIRGTEKLKDNDVFIEWNGAEGEDKWFGINKDKRLEDKIEKVFGSSTRTIVTSDGWKLSLNKGEEHELYFLKQDPYEQDNLYFKKGYEGKIRELSDKITNWMIKTNDVG